MKIDREGDQIVISLRGRPDGAFRPATSFGERGTMNTSHDDDHLSFSGDLLVVVVNLAQGRDGAPAGAFGITEARPAPAIAPPASQVPDGGALPTYGAGAVDRDQIVTLGPSHTRHVIMAAAGAIALLAGALVVGGGSAPRRPPPELAVQMATTVPLTTTSLSSGCVVTPLGSVKLCLPTNVWSRIAAVPTCC